MNHPIRASSADGPLTVAFHDLFEGGYEGGSNWLEVTCRALLDQPKPVNCLLVGQAVGALPPSLEDDRIIRIKRSPVRGTSANIRRRVLGLGWEDPALTSIASAQNVDVWVGFCGFEGLGRERPLLVWFPDFQFRHIPQLFSAQDIESRALQWRHVSSRAEGILAISNSVADDMIAEGGVKADRIYTLGFPPIVCEADLELQPADVMRKYDLPERYFLCCNQFMKHKNHHVVLDALSIIAAREGAAPVTVFTGRPNDYRDASFASSLLQRMAQKELRHACRTLGVVQRAEQIALIRGATAVIQPSLFEGRGAIAEEAAVLGTPVILSDLPVHHELNVPGSQFFDPNDALQLAGLITNSERSRRWRSGAEVLSMIKALSAEYGSNFYAVLREVQRCARDRRRPRRLAALRQL